MTEAPTSKPFIMMPPILLGVLAVFLSLAWLIPNHTQPWTSFHSDAVAGLALLIVTAWVLIRSRGKLELIGVGVLFLILALVPWLQYLSGLVYSFGTAWINSLYLIGFSLAIFVGWHWEKSTPGQSLDFLFMAICLAAFFSIGIQILQWLRVDLAEFWFLNEAGISRYYANLGQPNQLASLLLLGVLGVVWGYMRHAFGGGLAILLISYLLLGVALTESRTAWLNIFGIIVALFVFWRQCRPKYFGLIVLGFGAYFVALYFSLPVINNLLFEETSARRELADPIRLELWGSLLKAAMERPWFGYGWGQTTVAVFESSDFPKTGVVFKHAHNIVIDLVLYNGILLGGGVVVVVGKTLHRFLSCLSRERFIVPFLAEVLLLVHSMLEYPLHYAYFLLPFGMIVGVLALNSGVKAMFTCSKWISQSFVVAIACGLYVTVADGYEAERTYHYFYFGKKGLSLPAEFQPKLTVLTQWDDRLAFANSKPIKPFSPETCLRMKKVAITTPESFLIVNLARNLALNGSPNEAKEWLGQLCKIATRDFADELLEEWMAEAEKNMAYRAVLWEGCR